MRFFKHFTDAHEGRSMIELMNHFGIEGYGHYWILTELLVKKLEKQANEEFNDTHCKINLHERLLRERLRLSSTKLKRWLNQCSTLNLFRHEYLGNEIQFQAPKLLESMDRDSKRARAVRGKSASRPRLDIDLDKDKEKDLERDGNFISNSGEKTTKEMTLEERKASLAELGLEVKS